MKTIAYNPQREILTAILTLILSFSLLTALKAQGNAGPLSTKERKTEMTEEKAVKSTDTDLADKEALSNLLEKKIQSWMSDGSYWDKTSESEALENELVAKIGKWMADGSYWSSKADTETDPDQLALNRKGESKCEIAENDGK